MFPGGRCILQVDVVTDGAAAVVSVVRTVAGVY